MDSPLQEHNDGVVEDERRQVTHPALPNLIIDYAFLKTSMAKDMNFISLLFFKLARSILTHK